MGRRSARALSVAVLIVTVAIWLFLDGLAWPARTFTTFLLGPLPALLLLQARLSEQVPEEAGRQEVYLSSAVSIIILAALAMVAARFGGLSRVDLRLVAIGPGTLLAAAGLTTVAGVALMALGRILDLPESPLVDFLIPRNGRDRIAFAGLSITAGIGEELVFRSFLIGALLGAGASVTVAVAVSVVTFALSHAYQGVLGVIRVALLGVVLTAPFLLTGSVYPSVLAHAALDILAGIVLADWLQNQTR
jgi:membrane protease YdiL (CAAX protease family)